MDIFGEALFSEEAKNIFIHMETAEQSEIMLLSFEKILTVCTHACGFHSALIKNLYEIVARKNIQLNRKLSHITKRSTREKVLSYLLEQSKIQQNNSFQIPYDRQQLADYLSVERSALSFELSKLKNEGLIEYNKNSFTIL